MGIKIGEQGLERFLPPKRLAKIRKRIKESGALALASLSLVPPPFPFTPFVLAAGALEVRAITFFTTFAACRIIRFGIEASLAVRYGRRILQWLDSPFLQEAVEGCIVVAAVLTILSVVRIIQLTIPVRLDAPVMDRP